MPDKKRALKFTFRLPRKSIESKSIGLPLKFSLMPAFGIIICLLLLSFVFADSRTSSQPSHSTLYADTITSKTDGSSVNIADSQGLFMTGDITTLGNVGIGTTGPGALLDVAGTTLSGTGVLTLEAGGELTTAAGNDLNLNVPTTRSLFIKLAGSTKVTMDNTGNVAIGTTNPNEGKVEVKGGSVCVDTNSDDTASSCIASESDIRLKENISEINGALDKILSLRGVAFRWKINDTEVLSHYPLISRFLNNPKSVGMIAQEVAPVLPEAISQETVGDNETQYLQLDYDKFIPLLVEGMKELKQEKDNEIAQLKRQNEKLNADNSELHSRLEKLEAKIK